LLAYQAFYLCRQAQDREAAAAAARKALASGTLAAQGALGFQCAAFALFSAGLYEAAIAAYDVALAVARERGDSVRAPALLSFRGRALTLAGNLEAALADLRAKYKRQPSVDLARMIRELEAESSCRTFTRRSQSRSRELCARSSQKEPDDV